MDAARRWCDQTFYQFGNPALGRDPCYNNFRRRILPIRSFSFRRVSRISDSIRIHNYIYIFFFFGTDKGSILDRSIRKEQKLLFESSNIEIWSNLVDETFFFFLKKFTRLRNFYGQIDSKLETTYETFIKIASVVRSQIHKSVSENAHHFGHVFFFWNCPKLCQIFGYKSWH